MHSHTLHMQTHIYICQYNCILLHVPKSKKILENYLGQSLKGNAKPGMSTEFENVSVVIEEMFVEHLECRM